ncbi:MAG: hypothetical protein LUH54_05435, partial [Firmicutes bacterium]|nr:hypothetical protein [Bacillota bacterium]
VYMKIYNSLYYSKIIVLTHTQKPDWNDTPYNPNWIYVSGHTHRNIYKWDDECKIIADNQVGYHNTKIGFKSFWLEPPEDVFINFIDGIHKITEGQYMEFNHSKGIISYSNREMIDIYMIKKNKKYMFFAYCLPQERSKCKHLYMLCGGQIRRISSDDPSILSFYYSNLDKYVNNVNSLMSLYIPRLNALSQFVKLIGGSGNIHGCIIDIDIPETFFEFSRCHLYLNPLNNTYTAYYADSKSSRLVYADLRTLLVEQKEYCKNMIESFDKNIAKYAEISANFFSSNSLSEIDDNFILAAQSCNVPLDNCLEMYRISGIIKSLQYCVDNDVVRIWNDNLLNFDFTNCVGKDRRIEAINNNQEIVTGNNIKNYEDHFD